MKPKQYHRIVEVIEADAKARYKYITPNGNTCAIGGLLEAAGFPLAEKMKLKTRIIKYRAFAANDPRNGWGRLRSVNKVAITDIDSEGILEEMRQCLTKTYGLDVVQMESIQSENDSTSQRPVRKARILRYVARYAP